MNGYQIIMSIDGALTLLGIAYVLFIFKKLGRYSTTGRTVMVGPLFGGILIAIGFLGSMQVIKGTVRTFFLVLLLIGPGMVMYPLNRTEMFIPTKKFTLQFFLMLLTLFIFPRFPDPSVEIFYLGTLLALLALIHSLVRLRILSPFLRYCLTASSWLLVLYSWLRVFVNKTSLNPISVLILLVYSSALMLWIYSAMGIYDYLRRWL